MSLRGDDMTTLLDLVEARAPLLPVDRYAALRE
jgi:hypothetical protein